MASLAEIRELNRIASSRKVVGAVWADNGSIVPAPRPETHDGWMPFEVWQARQNWYDPEDPDAGWQTVPSARVLRKRAKAEQRRRARAAGVSLEALYAYSSGMADATDAEHVGWMGSA